ncbi:hypothetical protein ACFFON_06680 [Arthrobacter citreus]|uniref:hypothetical protein n=1 Tax=Arthrobacter TaxID=1663 RepID=UPI001264BA13|nr:hypothetical protein [Arthrobacter gandavensis]
MSFEAEEAFEGTLLRLKEAQNQREQFRTKWNAHLASVPYEFSLISDTAFDHRLMGHERRSVPPALGLHFGMWLQQQRAALDNALYACVGVRQNSFPPARENLIEFPITESPSKFRATKVIKNGVVETAVGDFLERNQPYCHPRDGSKHQDPHLSPLYWLNELARIDRHRVMHVGVGSMQISRDLILYAGAEHKVKHVVEQGHILTGSTSLVGFTTVKPLRYRTFRFTKRPQILPEISDWSQARWNIGVFGDLHDPDPAERYHFAEGYAPLEKRMTDVELLVIDICNDLASISGVGRIFDSVRSSEYSFRRVDHQLRAVLAKEAPTRRVNGL